MTSMLVPIAVHNHHNYSTVKLNNEGLTRRETVMATIVMPQCIFNFDDREIEIWDNPKNIWPEDFLIECALQEVEENGGWETFCKEAVEEGWTN